MVFEGRLQSWVNGKDVVLELLRRWGAKQSQGMGVEFVDRHLQLPIPFRNTIANMMAEAEAQNGIFAQDEITTAWFAARGIALPYPAVAPGAEARYEIDESLDLGDVVPMVAKPFSPGNAYPADEVSKRAHHVRQGADRLVRAAATRTSWPRRWSRARGPGDSSGSRRERSS